MLGLFGGLSMLTLLAINLVYLIFGADVTSLADEALDFSAASIRGEIVSIEPTFLHAGDGSWLQAQYRFTDFTGRMREGRALLRQTHLEPGDDCWIEFLANDPATNRLRGTTRQIQAPLLDFVLRWVLLPGTLLFLFWLQGVIRLRSMLRSGPATLAKVESLRRYAWINPPQLRVDYSFLDHRSREHHAWHWIRRQSQLGRELYDHDLSMPAVVFDESRPSRSWLVGADSFSS